MVSNFSKSFQAWKNRLKHWADICTFVAFLWLLVFYCFFNICNSWACLQFQYGDAPNTLRCLDTKFKEAIVKKNYAHTAWAHCELLGIHGYSAFFTHYHINSKSCFGSTPINAKEEWWMVQQTRYRLGGTWAATHFTSTYLISMTLPRLSMVPDSMY